VFFSLFGRKKTESKKAPITRQPVKPSPEKSAAPVAGPASEDSLDFSAYVPPPPLAPLPVSPAPAPAPQSAPQEADSAAPPLDVSALASSLAGQPGPAPSTEASTAIDDVATVIEETATLFASGQDEQALSALLRSLREEDLGNSAPQAWLMLLDLYQHLGMRAEFEEAAVNYAVTFEISPPSWEPQPGAEAGGSPVLRPVEAADQALILSGELSGASETLAKELQDWAGANKMLVIDMSRATRVDLATAGVMLDVFSKLQGTGTTIQIRGANELIRTLFEVTGVSKVARIIARK
jgi:anti-anti-sigma regulatory factor